MEIQIQQIILQMVNFGVLFFLLYKFLYKPILKILDERAQKVSEGLDAAERSITEQASLEERKQKEIKKAQAKASEVLEEAKKTADKLGVDIIAQARIDAKEVVKKEEAALMERLEKQERKLKSQVTKLVAATTQSVLKKALTPKHQQEILKNQLKDLKEIKVD